MDPRKRCHRMTSLDADATFVKLDKLRERFTRLEKNPDLNEWQYTRLLIRALTEGISKFKKSATPVSRKIGINVPEPVRGDWQELVDVLSKKGVKSEGRRRASSK
jgi:hypothetical protein